MAHASHVITYSLFLASTCSCFITLFHVIEAFYSSPPASESSLLDLLFDFGLVWLLFVQHSYLKSAEVKEKVNQLSVLPHYYRNLYVFTTCLVIEFIVWQWRVVPLSSLSSIGIDLSEWSEVRVDSSYLYTLHLVCWFLLVLQLVMLDVRELIGYKQISAHVHSTNYTVSDSLQRVYSHHRHPLIVMLAIILMVPVGPITLDRLMFGVLFLFYNMRHSALDDSDLFYLTARLEALH